MNTTLTRPLAGSQIAISILDEALDRAERYPGTDGADTRLAIYEMAIEGSISHLRRNRAAARRLSGALDVANRTAGACASDAIVEALGQEIESVRAALVEESLAA